MYRSINQSTSQSIMHSCILHLHLMSQIWSRYTDAYPSLAYQCTLDADGQLFYGLDGFMLSMKTPLAGNKQVKPKWTSETYLAVNRGETLRMKCIFEGIFYEGRDDMICLSNMIMNLCFLSMFCWDRYSIVFVDGQGSQLRRWNGFKWRIPLYPHL